jgi:hypothetical protein
MRRTVVGRHSPRFASNAIFLLPLCSYQFHQKLRLRMVPTGLFPDFGPWQDRLPNSGHIARYSGRDMLIMQSGITASRCCAPMAAAGTPVMTARGQCSVVPAFWWRAMVWRCALPLSAATPAMQFDG